MGLERIWIRTVSDGLLRADQVIGISCHRTPTLSGKPARWLVNAALAVPAGSGNAEGWDMANLHRTLAQTDREPRRAPEALARLLAQLATGGVGGIITPVVDSGDRGEVRFEFTPFDGRNGNGHSPAVIGSRDPVGVG
ncbi:hypothetical protein SAMN05421810_11354 [Amycolatopsis arida]|uniref:Uncharacterized protein n=1 Tax=Amycolatopsis arida TaxID=587909 RepID=A0A1I6ALA9_9PSEU|nr:hypothetical protein [Amycolatopsis arida]TDX87371.1 hypothetical protein CLV69_11354 [Amycolatopsis arida]SFQ69473.1 hypothetical protein SAMN05421810_11354 [Amycolatopsis arida]